MTIFNIISDSTANLFRKVAADEWNGATRLGNPSPDIGFQLRRRQVMAQLNPAGFRAESKTPKVDSNGMTRGERKRKRRVRANLFVSEDRPLEHMHSHARRRTRTQQLAEAA